MDAAFDAAADGDADGAVLDVLVPAMRGGVPELLDPPLAGGVPVLGGRAASEESSAGEALLVLCSGVSLELPQAHANEAKSAA